MKIYAFVLCIVAMLFASCTHNKVKESEEKFAVINPVMADTSFESEYVAQISAVQNVEIRARVKGYIETIYTDEGQAVQKGQTLFTISSKEYAQELQKERASTKSAEADLKSAEVELENTKRLLDKNIVASPELELMQAKVDALKAKAEEAKADEAQAELNLSFTEVKAPFDGVINRIPNKTGSLVEEGTVLTTLSNIKEMYAYFNVAEKDYLDLVTSQQQGKGKEVSLLLANNSLYPHKGVIETTESEFEKTTGNIAFRAKFINPEQLLKHGSTGKVLVKTEVKNAILIPQKCTFEVQDNTYVYVVGKGGKVEMRKIVPSLRLSQLYVVNEGLSLNDEIVYEGIQQVKEGETITTEKVSPVKSN